MTKGPWGMWTFYPTNQLTNEILFGFKSKAEQAAEYYTEKKKV